MTFYWQQEDGGDRRKSSATLQQQAIDLKAEVTSAQTKVKTNEMTVKHNRGLLKKKETDMKKTESEFKKDNDNLKKWVHLMWGGFNLEYGNLKNGSSKTVLSQKLDRPKTFNGFLKINLENGYLEKCVRNWSSPVYSDQ